MRFFLGNKKRINGELSVFISFLILIMTTNSLHDTK